MQQPPNTHSVGSARAGKRYRRETSTMPQWAGSCWYYLRYLQPWNTERPVDPEVEQYWLPVDLYVGLLPPSAATALMLAVCKLH